MSEARRRYINAEHLEGILHERPESGPEPTDQDRYYDGDSHLEALFPPWTDTSTKREAEL